MSTLPAAASEVNAVPAGLSSGDAKRRLAEQGPNEIRREKATSPWAILAAQFQGAMIWLLPGACVVSAMLGEVADAIAIVVLNAFVGFSEPAVPRPTPGRKDTKRSEAKVCATC